MNVVITTRHRRIRETAKQYALEKVAKLSHYFDRITTVHVVLDVGKGNMRTVELVIAASGGTTIVAEEKGPELFSVVDLAIHKAEAQLRKHKEKMQDRHRRRRPKREE